MAGQRSCEPRRRRTGSEQAGPSPDACARAAGMVADSARDAAEAEMLLDMLGLSPSAAPRRRHLTVVA